MKNDGIIMRKSCMARIVIILCTLMLLIGYGSAAGINIDVPTVNQGTHVFIGEDGLDITNALINPNTHNIVYYVGWWRSVASVGTTAADRYITIAPGSETDYFINPVDYTYNGALIEGAFYLCDQNSGMPVMYLGQPVVAYYVAEPHIELVISDVPCPDVNRTGQIFLGTNLVFNIKTNLYHIQNRPGGANAAIFDINVLGSNGKDYQSLLGPDARGCNCPDCHPNYPVIGIKDINILNNVYQWQMWDTDAVDPNTGLLYTPDGTYQISATCWANNIIDNNPRVNGAESAITQIMLTPEVVTVTVNPGNIVRTQTATATVVGKPRTSYIIGFIECPLKMSGEICDRPPYFVDDPLNPALIFDPVHGPYPVGNHVVYPSCCDGLTFRDLVPKIFNDGVLYYAQITTDCDGRATIDIDVDNTVWKADAVAQADYLIHVQKTTPECNDIYIFDQTHLIVRKGSVTIQFSDVADPANTPITEAFLGDTLKIAGVNTDSTITYLYMTGPCQPHCGGGLIPDPYPLGLIGDGPEFVLNSVPRQQGFDYIFTNPDANGNPRYWETKYLPINPGTYTIWAISNWPPNCPECMDCGENPCFIGNIGCPGCDGKICSITDCPNCDVYEVGTIILKEPELSASVDDYKRCCCPGYPCGSTIETHPLPVVGMSTGNPEKILNVWLFGKGKIGDVKYINTKVIVDCDGEFVFDVVKDLLNGVGVPVCRIDPGTYDLIIQDPGYNHQFDVIYEGDLDHATWSDPVEVNKRWIISGDSDIRPNLSVPDGFYSDDWRKLIQVEGPGYKLGTEVLRALLRGLDDPNIDDQFIHLQFTVTDEPCLGGTNFEADRTYGNLPMSVRFTDLTSGGSSWLWDFGDGTTSTEKNPIHVYESEGRYTVSLTVDDDDAGKAVKNDYIRVARGPLSKFTYTPDAVTAGIPVQFVDLSTGNPTGWLYTFGDGGTSSLQSPVYTYAKPGVYTVTLTTSDENGVSESATEIITVLGSATPVKAEFKTEVTGGTHVQFYDLSTGFGIISWNWDFGDGTGSIEQSPPHTYLKEGTYQVSLTVSNGDYSNTKTTTIGIR